MDIKEWMDKHGAAPLPNSPWSGYPQPYQSEILRALEKGDTDTSTTAESPKIDFRKAMQDISDYLESNNEYLCLQRAMDAVGCGSMIGIMNMTNLQMLKVTILDEENRGAAGFPPRMNRSHFQAIRKSAIDDPHGRRFPEPPKQGLA
jgi:hypothetical protein